MTSRASHKVSVRVNPEIKARLEYLASQLGVNVSDLVKPMIEMLARASEVSVKNEMRVKAVEAFLEVLEDLARKYQGIRVYIETRDRQDFPGQVEYKYAMICNEGNCEYKMIQADLEWTVSRREFAKALLDDYNWDVVEVIKRIKDSIF